MRIRENWDQSKDRFDLFEIDRMNANITKNNRIIVDSDYNDNYI